MFELICFVFGVFVGYKVLPKYMGKQVSMKFDLNLKEEQVQEPENMETRNSPTLHKVQTK